MAAFELDGRHVEVPDDGGSLLDALRDRLGVRSAKDGCSPQGQCGCCTVWVDGQPRVACVTPLARVSGRTVTTVDGLAEAGSMADALCSTGGAQCGFCTPGIVMRLAALPPERRDDPHVRQALLAHLCRCTGWQTIVEAVGQSPEGRRPARDVVAAERRALLEGAAAQRVDAAVALGRAGFAADSAPTDALVAARADDGTWHGGETLLEARRLAGKVQGRRTTAPLRWPVELPEGDWSRTLQTTWVEPVYLEPDAAWCRPGGDAVLGGNGGGFGAKVRSPVGSIARRLADAHGRAVLVAFSREDVVRLGPKRPPLAAGIRSDGSGILRVARTAGVAAAVAAVAPGLQVEEVEIPGPPTSIELRAAGWAEAAVLCHAVGDPDSWVAAPGGGRARATVLEGGALRVEVAAGAVLDEVVLRSYCIGAAHMGLGWVRSEGLAVGDDGAPLDLTIRSFGVVRAADMPFVDVVVADDSGPPVNGSDAVFAAVAAAVWRHGGFAPRWPTMRA